MPLWVLVPIIILATHRVTRLITRDALPIIAVPRERFGDRWASFADAKTKDEKKQTLSGKKTNVFMASIAYLWECDWCTSMYVAAGLTYVAYLTTSLGDHHWFVSILIGLAASTGTGLIAQREPE